MSSDPNMVNPFPGLRAFQADEDYLFFGREEQTLELLQRLGSNRFVAVVGTSGSGKSSLVRCGLLSELLGGKMLQAGAAWEVAVTHPGGNPLAILTDALLDADLYDREEESVRENLLATLSRSHFGLVEAVKQAGLREDTNFLLVVDQFEEIFRFHEAGQEQQEAANEFVSILLEAAAQKEVPIYVVLTMRSDFIGECGQFEGLAEMVNRGEFLIPRLTREQYKRVIEGPIKVAGGQIAPRLLQRLLNDLGQQADQLPCLQHALMRTWNVWAECGDTDALDLDDYQRVGKMTQALSLHADEIYASLASDRQRELCRGIFQALTVQETENRGIRRPQRVSALCQILDVQPDELIPIIDAYRHHGVTFLMPSPEVELTDQTIIDISHESLMRVWTRLRQWVDEEAQAAGIYRRLSESAALYEQGKAGLYRDPELGIALAWRDAKQPNETWARRYHRGFSTAIEFLEASQRASVAEVEAVEAARQRELAQAQQLAEVQRLRLEQQNRAARRLRGMLAGLGVVAVIAGIACVAALLQYKEADRLAGVASEEAQNARDSATEADTLRLAAEEAQRQTAGLLVQVEESLETAELAQADALEQAIAAERAREEADRQRLLARRSLYSSTVFTAQRSIENPGATSRHEELLADLRPQAGEVDLRDWEWYYLQSQADESRLVMRGHASRVNCAKYSSDGNRLLTAGEDGLIKVRDARTGTELLTLAGHSVGVWDANWSHDDRWIVSGGADNLIRIWDAETGIEVRTLTGHAGTVYSVEFSPDDTKLASGSSDALVKVWDFESGVELQNIIGHNGAVWDVRWSPDGEQLASGGIDRLVGIWNAETGARIHVIAGHTLPIYGLAWSHNGRQLASIGQDASRVGILIWDTATGEELRALRGHTNSGFRVDWSEDDSLLASAGLDNTARVWDMQTGQQVRLFADNVGWVMDVDFSSDGSQLLTAIDDGSVNVRTVERNQGLRIAATTGEILSIDWSPDGRYLATPESDQITVFDVATQSAIMRFRGHTAHPLCVAFSPDGTRVVSSGVDSTIRVWDVETGEEVWNAIGTEDGNVNMVAWSQDGRRIASAGDDDTVRIFEAATGEQLHSLRADEQDSVRLAVAWSPDGTLVASDGYETDGSGNDEVVVVWNAETGEVMHTLRHRGASWRTIAFSPDGDRVAAGGSMVSEDTFGGAGQSSAGLFVVWDLETEQELLSQDIHQTPVSAVEWNHEGSRLLSAGRDGGLHIWGAESGQELLALQDDATPGLYTARFSPDGMRIAAAAGGEAIRIWDATPGYARELSPRLLPMLAARIDAAAEFDDLKLRGEIFALQGEWELAADDFQRAAELQPVGLVADKSPWFTSPWWVVGPYPELLDAEQPPETHLDPGEPVPVATNDTDLLDPLVWQSLNLDESAGLDLGRFFDHAEHVSGYAQLRIYSPVEQSAGVLMGADDSLRVWLNGELIHSRSVFRLATRDDEALEIHLQPGWNTLLTKVANNTRHHGLFLRLSDDPAELARVFEKTNHWDQAVAQWTRATERRPDDAQLQFTRGRAALLAGDVALAEQALTIAATNSSDLASGWQQARRVYQDAGRLAEAADALEESVTILEATVAADPNDGLSRGRLITAKTELVIARLEQGVQLWQDTRLADAVEVWQSADDVMQSLRDNFSDSEVDIDRIAQANLAVVLAFVQHGLWEDASQQLIKLGDGRVDSGTGLFISAILQLFAGDVDAYRVACRRSLEIAEGTNDTGIADRVAKTCLLIPGAVDDLESALTLAERAYTGTEESGNYIYFQMVKGLAEYRRGNHQAVIDLMETNRREHQERSLNVAEDLLVAMAYYQLGDSAQARHWLDQAHERMAEMPSLGLGELSASGYFFADQMRAEILLGEAETLINGAPPAENPLRRLERALAFSRLGQVEQADTELTAAGETAFADLRGLVIRTHVLAHRGDETTADALTTAAQQLADHATAADAQTIELWTTLAEGYAALSLFDEAAHAYRNAVSIQSVLVSSTPPTSADLRRLDHLYERLAAIHETAGQSEQALIAASEPDLLRTAFDIVDPLRPRPQETDATRKVALTAMNSLVANAEVSDAAGDSVGQRYMARLLRRRGQLFQQARQPESAANDLQQARLLLEQILAAEPESVECAGELAGVLGQSFAGWSVPTPNSMRSAGGTTLTVQSDGSILASGTNPDRDTYTITVDPGKPFVTGIKLELLPDPSLPFGVSGRAPGNGNCVLSEFEVSVVMSPGTPGTTVVWQSAISDHRVAAAAHYGHMEMHAGNAIDGDLATYWEPFPRNSTPKTALFLPIDRIETPPGTQLVIRLISAAHIQHNLGRFRLSLTGSPTPEFEGEQEITSPWVRLAMAYANLGDPVLSATHFARVLDTTSDIAERRASIDQAVGWADAFTELLKLRPEEPLLYAALARRYADDGEIQLATEARSRARVLLEQALIDHPEDETYATVLADFLLESSRNDTHWTILRPIEAISSEGATLTILDDGSVLAGGEFPETDTYTIVADTPSAGITAFRLEALTDDSLPQKGPGRFSNGNFVLNEFTLSVRDAAVVAPTVPRGRYVRIDLPGSDRILTLIEVEVFDGPLNLALSGTARQSSVDYQGPPERAIDGNTDGIFQNGSGSHTRTETNPWWELDLGAEREFDNIVIWNRTDGNLAKRLSGFRLSVLNESRQPVFEQSFTDPPATSIAVDLIAASGMVVPFSAAFADYSQDDPDARDVLPVAEAIDGDPRSNSGWGIHPQSGQDHLAIFEVADISLIDGNSRLTFRLVQNWGEHPLGRFRLAATTTPQQDSALKLRQAIARGQLTGRGALAAARAFEGDIDAALVDLDDWRNTFASGSLRIEAEDYAAIDTPWEIVEDEVASGGRYAIVPNGTGNGYSPEQNPQALHYNFHIETADAYRFFVLCLASTGNEDSIWVSMDGSPRVQWSLLTGEHWAWGNAVALPAFTLAAGDHTLTIGNREDGYAIDAMLLVPETNADAYQAASEWHAIVSALVLERLDQSASVVEHLREAMRWSDLNRVNWQQSSLGAIGLQAVALAINSAPDAADLHDFRGRALGWQNRRTEAIAAYTQALAIDPQRIDTRTARAALYATLGQNESALSDYNIAIRELQEQNHIGATGNAALLSRARGNVYYELESWEAAAADYREFFLARGTTDVNLIVRMAEAHEKAGQWQQAADAWTRALEQRPDDQNYLRSRSNCYAWNLRQHDLAIADYSRLLELNPNDPWRWIHRAEMYLELRDWDFAMSNLARAATVAGDDNSRSKVFEVRASVAAMQGDWELALANLRQASELQVPADRFWEVARDLALLEAWLGDLDAYRAAASGMDRALVGNNDANRNRHLLWTLLVDTQDLSDQERDRLSESAGKTTDRWPSRLTADIELRSGRPEETARLYEQDGPQEPCEYFSAALAQHLLGDEAQARLLILQGNHALQRLRMRDPDAIVPPGLLWCDWLTHLLRKREVEDLIVAPQLAELDEALQSDPDNAALLIERAEINAAYGRTAELLADLNRTSRRLDDIALLARRASLRASAGQVDQALLDYEQLAALEPENSVWSERLAQFTPRTSAVWNFDNSVEGWEGNSQIILTPTAGTLRTGSLGIDPIMYQTVAAPSGWHVLTIKARASQTLPLQVWWETLHGGPGEPESRHAALTESGEEWQTLRILFQSIGDVTRLRLDSGNAAGQQWEIDSITLESVGDEELSVWADELVARIGQGAATSDDVTELSAVLEAISKTPLVSNSEDWNAEPTSWSYTIFEPVENWTATNFNDDAWMTGSAPFGTDPETHDWSRARARTRWGTDDVWLRHEFALNDIPTGPLTFRLKHDDDVEVYLNGVKAVELGGAYDYLTVACPPEAAATLRPGSNVIAVHCINGSGPCVVDVGLYAAGSNDQLLDILTAVLVEQPGNQPLLRLRGNIQFDRQQWQAAVDDYSALLGSDVSDVELIRRRSEAFTHLEQWDQAAADIAVLMEPMPRNRNWTSERSRYLLNLAKQEELYAALLEARPEDTHLRRVWCRHLALSNRWPEAAEAIDWAASPSEIDTEEWLEIGGLLLVNNETAEYQELLAAAVLELDKNDPLSAFTLARTYSLVIQPLESAEQAVRWAESAVEASRTAWYLHALGMAYYRVGRYDEAIKVLEESNATNWADAGKAQNWLVLAMIYHELGDTAAAEDWLSRADDWLADAVERAEGGRTIIPATDWFPINVLRREAGALIDPDNPPSP